MHNRVLQLILMMIVALGLILAQPRSVSAQSPSETIQVSPTFQEIVLSDERASASGSISLTNTSKTAQSFTVYAVDIQQFDSDGRVILADKPLAGSAFSLADFIELSDDVIEIPSGSTAQISFTIRQDQSLSPGGHYAAVVAKLSSAVPANQQVVLPAVSSFVLVRKVGGEQFHLSLGENALTSAKIMQNIPTEMSLTFSNEGNVHVIPHGMITFTDVFGRLVAKGIVNENSVFVMPQTQRDLVTHLSQVNSAFPVMAYKAEIQGKAEPGGVEYSQVSTIFIVHPAVYVLLGIGVCLIFVSIIRKRKRKTKSQ